MIELNREARLLQTISLQAEEIRFLRDKIKMLEEKNRILTREIAEHIDKDCLTGLYNRQFANKAYENSNIVIMCDIDDFKAINDTYGHNIGDVVLVKFADILTENVKSFDYIIRWGGEEFVIFLKDSSLESAEMLTEHIRKKIALFKGAFVGGVELPEITLSFGISKLHSSDSLLNDMDLVDRALYNSKRNGKNRVTVLGDDKVKKLTL